MKSVRDILLQRHQSAGPRLDAVRKQVLDALPAQKETRPQRTWLAAFLEFVRVPRVAWGALGAAWLVIIALNVVSSDRFQTTPQPLAQAKPSPETLQALREQRRLFAELTEPLDPPEATAPKSIPRPRSARQPDIAFA